MKERLFGEVRFWNEVRYEIRDRSKAEKYLYKDRESNETINKQQTAYQLSQGILRYMNGRMRKEQVEADEEWLSDIKRLGEAKAGEKYTLRCYQSANQFHKKLKGLYR